MESLRPYQVQSLELLRLRWRDNPVLCLPTGAGKTVVAAALMRAATARGRRCLIVASSRTIVLQTARRFREHGLSVGVVMGEHHEPDAPVICASVQTLRRHPLPAFDVTIVDEAHHAISDSYKKILTGCFIGLTATPERLDGRGLREAGFGAIVEPVTMEQLFTDGYLARPVIYAPTVPDLQGVHVRAGEFVPGESERRITGRLVDHYRELCDGARAVAFACSVEHSQRIVQGFLASGIHAEHLDGTSPQLHRDAVLARLADGTTKLVSNCGLFGEGFDLPSLEVVLLARPTLSIVVHRQQCGRVMRVSPGKSKLILDHAGNCLRLGLPWDPHTWSLDGRPPRASDERLPPCKRCGKCFAVVPASSRVCPECGAAFASVTSVPSETSERLQKLDDASAKRRRYTTLVQTASHRGYRLGWARVQYRDLYGVWPKNMREIEDGYQCVAHEPKRSERRAFCGRCLRTLDSAGRTTGDR